MAAKKTLKKTPLKRKVKTPPTKAVKKASKKAASASEAASPSSEKKQTKTAFVLSFPAEIPAKDVVAKGAEQGIALTEKGIYKTRYLARTKAPKAAKTALATTPKTAPKAKMPGKRGPGDGSGSAFIRSQPLTMKAGEVVATAAAKGITITPGLVYSVRQAMRKSGKAAPSAPAGKRRGRPPAAAAATPKAVVVAGGGDRERQLVRIAVDIGLARAVELIQDFKSKIATLY